MILVTWISNKVNLVQLIAAPQLDNYQISDIFRVQITAFVRFGKVVFIFG